MTVTEAMNMISAPESIRKLFADCMEQDPNFRMHPGLRLDRYLVPTIDQMQQKDRLATVLGDFAAHQREATLGGLLKRRAAVLGALGATEWERATITPLTLHLGRAGILENAGILLHAIHGVPYLPGESLKGMARSFAETVWHPTQAGPDAAWKTIERVFGWAPGSDREKPWKPSSIGETPESASGRVVFHDAWPTAWPKLVIDIVNCHHKAYYRGQEGRAPEPPGDWEDPEPSYFLALAPGATFTFALSARRRDEAGSPELELARTWLDAALTHLGYGAKTGAGYGYFHSSNASNAADELPASRFASSTSTLTLVTPAYLAGANQEASDCNLHEGTLRGLLRYWWRALHAGHIDTETLRRLEAFLWGDTNAGRLISTIITRGTQRVGTERSTYRGYLNYGMSENQRPLAPESTSWTVRLTARSHSRTPGLDAQSILEQAFIGLSCLGQFGGLGAKARKGYGSFEINGSVARLTLNECRSRAAAFRDWARLQNERFPGMPDADRFDEHYTDSPAFGGLIGPREWVCRERDARALLELIDRTYKEAARRLAKADRLALGLPRRGQGSRSSERHASPVHIHVERAPADHLLVRALAFPSRKLERPGRSHAEVLENFLDNLHEQIRPFVFNPPVASAPAPPALKKIERGQERVGRLVWTDQDWTVAFEADDRPVKAQTKLSLEERHHDWKVQCYILEANKKGITARLDKLLDP